MFDNRLVIAILAVLITLNVNAEPSTERQVELAYLLKHDCGSCHGMRLEGGLGPALKPEQLQGFTIEAVAATILQGRAGTPMPPWHPFLSGQEARWVATQLKMGRVP